MGNTYSNSPAIRKQEAYVKQRMEQADMKGLSQMRGGFFHSRDPKYNEHQLKGYLRQEYYGRRERDAYVLDSDLAKVGTTMRRR